MTHVLGIKLDAYALILGWAISLVVLSVGYEAYQALSGRAVSAMEEILVPTVFSSAVLFGLIYRAAGRFSPRGFWFNIGFDRGAKSPWHVWVFPAATGFVFACISASILLSRKDHPDTPLGDILKDTQSPEAVVIFLLLAIIMAPFIEELAFRGYFYHVIKKAKGRRYALVSIALAFGGLHMHQYWGDWAAIGMVFVLGAALTAFRFFTGGVKASMVMHYVYNTAATVIPMIVLMTSHSAYFQYKALYDQLNFEQKQTLLEKAIEQDPAFAPAYNDLAWLHATEGAADENTLDLINVALEYEPENTAYLDTKAEVLEKMGFHEEALSVRENILALESDQGYLKEQQGKVQKLKALLKGGFLNLLRKAKGEAGGSFSGAA